MAVDVIGRWIRIPGWPHRGVMRDLDAAGLASVTDFYLRLDNTRVADLIRSLGDFMGVLSKDGTRGGDVLLLKQLTCLVFVKIH